MARLPVPGADSGLWGDILNDFLSVSLNSDGSIKTSAIAGKADDSLVVHLAGIETITGTKTFSVSPTVPTPTNGFHATTKNYVDSQVASKADDTSVVHDSGDETIAGIKTFFSSPIVPTPTNDTEASTKAYVDTKVANAAIPRVSTLTVSSNTYTPNCSTTDLAKITSPATDFTVANPSGTPNDGQKLTLRITSNSTGRAPTWGSAYLSSGAAALPTTALPASKTVTLGFIYDSEATKWVLLASDMIGY